MPRSIWDVSEGIEDLANDGLLLKSILIEGSGNVAERGAKVTLKYSLRLSDDRNSDTFDSSAHRKNGALEFTLGRQKVIPALEIVARSMKIGEKCRVRAASPYAFGAKGLKRKSVPPNSTVYIEVEMVDFDGGEARKPFSQMTPSERFEAAQKCKESGNNFFKELKYERAMAHYSQCIQYLAKVFYKTKPSTAEKDSIPSTDQTEVREQPDGVVATGSDANINGNQDNVGSRESSKDDRDDGFEEARIRDNPSETQEESLLPSADMEKKISSDTQSPVKEEKPNSEEAEVEEVVETLDVSTASQSTEKLDNHSEKRQEEADVQESKADSETNGVSGTTLPDTLSAQAAMEESNATEGTQNGEQGEADGDASREQGKGPDGKAEDVKDGLEGESDAKQGKEDESVSPSQAEVASLHVTTLNNLSLCLLKLENYKEAVESASLALRVDSSSSKALYYRYVFQWVVSELRRCSTYTNILCLFLGVAR